MDLPSRLSDQQKFILAYLADSRSPTVRTETVSHAVATEFGRIMDRNENLQQADDVETLQVLAMVLDSLDKQEVVTNEHSASFSRAASRLEDRGLLLKNHRQVEETHEGEQMTVVSSRPSQRAKRIGLTDDGEEVGNEVLRRQRDGRYGLSFDSLE